MATPQISPAVADGRIDAGITRGEQPGRGVRRFVLRRMRVGVQLAQHHPLAEHEPGLTWRPLRGAPSLTIHLVLPREQSPLHRRVRAVAKTLAHELRWLSD